MPNLEVSIIQEDCLSCQLCTDIAEKHFFMGKDSLAYVKEESLDTPDEIRFRGHSGKVAVASELEDDVIEAAEECPGECIYVEEREN